MYKGRFYSFVLILLAVYLIAGVGFANADDLYYPRMPGAKITHTKLSSTSGTKQYVCSSSSDNNCYGVLSFPTTITVACNPSTDSSCNANTVPLGNCDPDADPLNDGEAKPLYQKSCSGQGITQSNFLINVTFDPKQPSPYSGTGAMVHTDGDPTLPLCSVTNSMVCTTSTTSDQTALGSNPTCYTSSTACTSAGKTCPYEASQNPDTCNSYICPWSEVLDMCNASTGQNASTCGFGVCPAGSGCVAATNPVVVNPNGCYALQRVEYGSSTKNISRYGTDGTSTVSYNNSGTGLGDKISAAGFVAPAVVGGQITYGGSSITYPSSVNIIPISGNVQATLKDGSGNTVYTKCQAPSGGSVITYNGITYTFTSGTPTPTDASPPTGSCTSGTTAIIDQSTGNTITSGVPILVNVVYTASTPTVTPSPSDGITSCTVGATQQYANGKYVRDASCNPILDSNNPSYSSSAPIYLKGGEIAYNSNGSPQTVPGEFVKAVTGISTSSTIANSLYNTVFHNNSATLQNAIENLPSQTADLSVNSIKNIIPGTTITRVSFNVIVEGHSACVYAYTSDPGTWRAEYAYPTTLNEVYGQVGGVSISAGSQPLLSNLKSTAGMTGHCVKMPPPTISTAVLSWGASSISPICTEYNTSSSNFYGKDVDGKIVKKAFTGVVVECIRDSMLSIFFPSGSDEAVSFFIQVQTNLRQLIMLVLVLYIILFGYKVLMSHKPPKKEEGLWLVLKFALMGFFALGSGMTQLLPIILSIQDRMSIIFMEAGLGQSPLTVDHHNIVTTLQSYNDAKEALSNAPLSGSATAANYLNDATQHRTSLESEIAQFTTLTYQQTNVNNLTTRYNTNNSDCIANGGTTDSGLQCLNRKYNDYIAQKEAAYITAYTYENTPGNTGNYTSSGSYKVPSFCTAVTINLQGGGAAGTFKPYDNTANTAAKNTYQAFAEGWVTYTSSGAYTVPSFCKGVQVQAWGGGAAGRYSASAHGGDYDVTGGSGAYVDSTGTSSAGTSYAVTIGSGGTSLGASGGATSFGSYVIAGGGTGGAAANASNITALGGYTSGSWISSSTKTGTDGTSCSNTSISGIPVPSSLSSPSAQTASACPYNGTSVLGAAAVGFGSGGCCADDVVSQPVHTDDEKTAQQTAYKNSYETKTYSAGGTYKVPSFCKKVKVEVWGGGGAGRWETNLCGGDYDVSGGSGGYATASKTVTAGQSIAVVVGGGASSKHADGGASSVDGVVIANGGHGGDATTTSNSNSASGGTYNSDGGGWSGSGSNGSQGTSTCIAGAAGAAAPNGGQQPQSVCDNCSLNNTCATSGVSNSYIGSGGCSHDDAPSGHHGAWGFGGPGQVIVKCDQWDFTDFSSSNVASGDGAGGDGTALRTYLQDTTAEVTGSWGQGGSGELRAKCSSFDFADLTNVITNPSADGYTPQATTLLNTLYGNSPSGGSGAKASATYALPANNAGTAYTVSIGNGGSGSGNPGVQSYFGSTTLMYANGGSGVSGGTAGGTITGISPTTGTSGTTGLTAVAGASSPSGGAGQPSSACTSGGSGSATNGGGGCASYQNQMDGAGAKGSASANCSTFTFSSSSANINDSNADATDAHIIAQLLAATPNDIQVKTTTVAADQQSLDAAALRYCTDITAYCADIAAIRNYEYSINQLNNNNALSITPIPTICSTTYSYTDSAGTAHNCNTTIPASPTCQYPACNIPAGTEASLQAAVTSALAAYNTALQTLAQDQATNATSPMNQIGYQYCDFSSATYPAEKGYMQLWDTIDCKISRYLGIGSDTSSSAKPNDSQFLRATILAPVSASYGFPIFILGTIFIVITLMIIVRVVHIYIMALIALVLLFYISPLVIPSFLFKFTSETIFTGYVQQILLFWLQPIFLFAYLAFMFICIDTIMFAGNHKFDKDNLVADASGNTISHSNSDCEDPKAVGCILQQMSVGSTNYPSDKVTMMTVYHMNFPDEGQQLCIGLLKLMIIIYIAYAIMETLERISSQLVAPFALGGADGKGAGSLSSAPVAAPSAVFNKMRQGANTLKGVGEKALGGVAYAVKNPDKISNGVKDAASTVKRSVVATAKAVSDPVGSAKSLYASAKDAAPGQKFMNELGAAYALGKDDKQQAEAPKAAQKVETEQKGKMAGALGGIGEAAAGMRARDTGGDKAAAHKDGMKGALGGIGGAAAMQTKRDASSHKEGMKGALGDIKAKGDASAHKEGMKGSLDAIKERGGVKGPPSDKKE